MNPEENKTKPQRFPSQKTNEQQQYLGPGCYEMSREFDKNMAETKGNLITSKVNLRQHINIKIFL